MMSDSNSLTDQRLQLERRLGADLRELAAESDWMGRVFSGQNNLSPNEFRALQFVMIAETQGIPRSSTA